MEDNIEIEISETNRGNEQIIINKKYKFNITFQRKDKSKIYRRTKYKTSNKCKFLIILNDKKEVLKYESLHNSLEKEIDVSISVAKHKIKEEIRKNSIPMDIKPKHIFNAVSQEMGLICPEYSTIRSQIIRNINKQFPPNIKSLDDILKKIFLVIINVCLNYFYYHLKIYLFIYNLFIHLFIYYIKIRHVFRNALQQNTNLCNKNFRNDPILYNVKYYEAH